MLPLFHRLYGRLRQRLGLDEPLGGNERLDHRLAALALPDRPAGRVRSWRAGRAPAAPPPRCSRALRSGPVRRRRRLRQVMTGVLADDLDLGQVVPLAGFEVVGVVSGGDLHDARAELRVRQLVQDDGDLAVHERQQDALPVEGAVARVRGVDGDTGIAPAWSRAAWWQPPDADRCPSPDTGCATGCPASPRGPPPGRKAPCGSGGTSSPCTRRGR